MNGLLRPARRTTLADDVYESVRALVMEHAVAPGERINIDALARRLEVSPTPVREALARLESDGLVRKRPLAGYTAAPLLTRTEFDELVEMRLILETASARRVAERFAVRHDPAIATATAGADGDTREPEGGTGEPDGGIRKADGGTGELPGGLGGELPGGLGGELAELRQEAELPDPVPGTEGFAAIAAFTAQDARFHHLLAERSGNRMLHSAVVRLRAHLHLFRLHFPTAHYGISGREHLRIVDAIGTGDPDAAGTAMREHLLAAADRHLPFFEGTRCA